MPMKFTFLTDALMDARATLYMRQSLITWYPVAQVPVQNLSATFPINPTSPMTFAFTIEDMGDMVARSGRLDLSAGEWDQASGTFTATYYLQETEDPMTIAPSELDEMAPSVPQTFDDGGSPVFRMDRLDLNIKGNVISAEGDGEYLRRGAGPLTFVYEFRLKPSRGLLRVERVIDVETVYSRVRSARTGFGRITNPIINLVLRFLRDSLSDTFRDSIQAAIDETVAEEMAEFDVGAPITVTLRAVEITESDGVTIWPLGLLNLQSVCPSSLSAQTNQLRSKSQVRALARMRDRVLTKSSKGRELLDLFERHRGELTRLLLTHPQLLKQFDQTINTGLNDFSIHTPEAGTLSKETHTEAARFVRMLKEVGSFELAQLGDDLLRDTRALVDRPVGQVFRRWDEPR